MDISDIFNRNQKDYYTGLLHKHDVNSPHAVAWYDGGQKTRFGELLKIVPDRVYPYSLLDAGCGVGDLYGYLHENGYSKVRYTGIDAVEEMVAAARRKYPGIAALRLEFLADEIPGEFDFLVCSGTMNFRMFRSLPRQKEYIAGFISRLYEFSRLGCSFNLLSRTEKRHFRNDEHIYYADSDEIYRICSEICTDVGLSYRSEIFGFTVYMRKG